MAEREQSKRVLILDDEQVVLDTCTDILDGAGLEVITTTSVQECFDIAASGDIDLFVTDIMMPELNGVEATRQILAAAPNSRVVALSIHRDRRFVTHMLRAGAAGYVLKGCSFEELVRAIRAAAAGQVYLTPEVASALAEGYGDALASGRDFKRGGLSPREREVLQLLAEGLNTKQTAARLGIQPKTVSVHRHRIMRKLGVESAAEMVRWAIRDGITTLGT